MTILFVVLVVLGFALRFLGALPAPAPRPGWIALAWTCWLNAAIIWAIPRLH